MAEGEAVDVPIAWLWAEQAAEALITSSDGAAQPATFGFRATRDVLALTLFLTGIAGHPADLPTSYLQQVQDHLSIASVWMAWCRSRLDREGGAVDDEDMRLARNAWCWLGRSRMLAGLASPDLTCGDVVTALPGAGRCIGLDQARRIIDERLAGDS